MDKEEELLMTIRRFINLEVDERYSNEVIEVMRKITGKMKDIEKVVFNQLLAMIKRDVQREKAIEALQGVLQYLWTDVDPKLSNCLYEYVFNDLDYLIIKKNSVIKYIHDYYHLV